MPFNWGIGEDVIFHLNETILIKLIILIQIFNGCAYMCSRFFYVFRKLNNMEIQDV
ncbi:hypothetical protein GCM10008119_32420 [Pedobacter mendelii]|uniref:Uncharacterized protein n=1 Tax=Pedobacter mendelii TaxID=1908240 RepID=A0ABQ2BKL3_9SPHI|nr:hypothetical protein GCM10008119_32420 [Pedobacter mendelii]